MEFYEKLQELRKNRGLTQGELAEILFVSRTAISKWESGRGYPGIDSLRAISRFFSVSLDDLLSSDTLLYIAEEDGQKKQSHIRNPVFGLLDCCMALLLFVPLFGQRTEDMVRNVALITLTGVAAYVKAVLWGIVSLMTLCGVLTLALQNGKFSSWLRKISLVLGVAGTLIFVVTLQPYAAVFVLVPLIIKTLLVINRA